MPRRALVLLVLGLVVGVAGVAVARAQAAHATQVPGNAARRAVEHSVHDAYPTLAFGNVACPHEIRRARGVTFTCTVQLPGTFLLVDAEQTDGKGTIELTTQEAVIPTPALRDFVAEHASLPATVDCGGGPFRVARAGQVIPCRAALADGTTLTVQLTVLDTAGNVALTSVN